MHIPFIWSGARYESKHRRDLTSLQGLSLGEIDELPSIVISRVAHELKATPKQALADIHQAFKKAADLFGSATLDGESPQDYVRHVHLISGVPLKAIESSVKELSHAMATAGQYITGSAPNLAPIYTEDAPRKNKTAYWIPKGQILSVIAPGNNPAVHKAWIEALAAGYKILLRPSAKDPFTPYRLIRCLLAAGISPSMIALVPGDHSIVQAVVEAGDLALVFGDRNTVEQYKSNPKVITRGPGYSKVYWHSDASNHDLTAHDQAIDVIVRSIVDGGGMKCTNASGVVVNKAHIHELDEIAQQLNGYGSNGLLDYTSDLPVFTSDKAYAIRDYVHQIFHSTDILWKNAKDEEWIIDYGDGTAALAPLLVHINHLPDHIRHMELPFACSWVYTPEPDEVRQTLKSTLALSLLTEDQDLIHWAITEPTIKKLVIDNAPTWTTYDLVPHDGFITEHLFISKGVI
ncbi:aldehyde dehydrogenase family protein [Paenibacillus sp. FSL L8-0158]|uniref:aldehyde dehydrogenase family protein n=1 Tax=Paenibacillus sp. FSL L8-0158 TaxID=2954752 RepID=UPI0031596C45